MTEDVIFTPLAVPQPHGQEPHLPLEHFRPVRQRGRLAHPDPHQLGMQVRRRRRRRDHLVLRAGADGGPDHRRLRHHPPRRFHPAVAARSARRCTASTASTSCSSAIPAGRWTPGRAQLSTVRRSSSTSRKESLHGFLCRRCRQGRDRRTWSSAFAARRLAGARGRARRRRAARRQRLSVHAVPSLRASTTAPTNMAARCTNRARFLLEVIRAIRARGRPRLPSAGQAQRRRPQQRHPLGEEGQHARRHHRGREMVRERGRRRDPRLDRLAVSASAQSARRLLLRDHRGDLRRDDLVGRRRASAISCCSATALLRPIFRWIWFRMKKGLPIEGVSLDEARAIKAGGRRSRCSTPAAIRPPPSSATASTSGAFDGVAIARSLVANNDLVQQWRTGRDLPERPCTYCNKCLLNAPKNPMGCYELARFPSREAMIDELMTIYAHAPDAAPAAGARAGGPKPMRRPNRPSPTSRSSSRGAGAGC